MASSLSWGSGSPQPHLLSFPLEQKSLEVQVGRYGGGHRGREHSVPVISHFGHSLAGQLELLILVVYVKLYIGSRAIITYIICFSFGDPLAEQSQPRCLLPGDTGLVSW